MIVLPESLTPKRARHSPFLTPKDKRSAATLKFPFSEAKVFLSLSTLIE